MKGTVICFRIGLSQRLEADAVACLLACVCSVTTADLILLVVFWRVSAAWQRPTSFCPSYRETDSQFEAGGVTPFAIFTRFGNQRFSPLFASEGHSTWMSPQTAWGGKIGGTWLAGTATRRLLLPRNLCLSGTLEEVCRTWWGLHWRLLRA